MQMFITLVVFVLWQLRHRMNEEPREGEPELLTLGTFRFDDISAAERIELKIQQVGSPSAQRLTRKVMEEDYGLFMWVSSKVLAEYLWLNRDRLQGKRVLEVHTASAF